MHMSSLPGPAAAERFARSAGNWVNLTYDVFDFGKRHAVVRERETQLAQAQEHLTRLKENVGVQLERSLNIVERTKQMLLVATEGVRLREEGERRDSSSAVICSQRKGPPQGKVVEFVAVDSLGTQPLARTCTHPAPRKGSRGMWN